MGTISIGAILNVIQTALRTQSVGGGGSIGGGGSSIHDIKHDNSLIFWACLTILEYYLFLALYVLLRHTKKNRNIW